MTSVHHDTGTDRIAEVAKSLDCDIVVNVQGDEPLIRPEMIDEALLPLVQDASIPMGTLCRKIEDREEAFDPNVVKVVFDKNRLCALFFPCTHSLGPRRMGRQKLVEGIVPCRPHVQAHRSLCVPQEFSA